MVVFKFTIIKKTMKALAADLDLIKKANLAVAAGNNDDDEDDLVDDDDDSEDLDGFSIEGDDDDDEDDKLSDDDSEVESE